MLDQGDNVVAAKAQTLDLMTSLTPLTQAQTQTPVPAQARRHSVDVGGLSHAIRNPGLERWEEGEQGEVRCVASPLSMHYPSSLHLLPFWTGMQSCLAACTFRQHLQ